MDASNSPDALVGTLAAKDAVTVGRRVLAVHSDGITWMSGQATRTGSTIDVSFGGSKSDSLLRTKALVVASDGAGALVREAAGAGHASLVDALLAVGVSAFVADAQANTPLHMAAAAGHVCVCRALPFREDHARSQPLSPSRSLISWTIEDH